MTLRFLAVQLCATIVIALARISFHLACPARMKWKPPTIGVTFERLKQQLANPYEGVIPFRTINPSDAFLSANFVTGEAKVD